MPPRAPRKELCVCNRCSNFTFTNSLGEVERGVYQTKQVIQSHLRADRLRNAQVDREEDEETLEAHLAGHIVSSIVSSSIPETRDTLSRDRGPSRVVVSSNDTVSTNYCTSLSLLNFFIHLGLDKLKSLPSRLARRWYRRAGD